MIKNIRVKLWITTLMIMIVVSLLMSSLVATANDMPATPNGIYSYQFLPDPDYLQSDTKALIRIDGDSSGLPPIYVEWEDPQGTTVSCGTLCEIINEYSPNGTLVAVTWEFYIASYLRPPGTYTAIVSYCSFMVNTSCITWTESFRANFTIGSVTNTISGNAGIAGATLFYFDGMTKTVVADGTGNYTITINSGWSGTVRPTKTGFTFLPVSRTYTNVITAQTEQNYTATPINYPVYLPVVIR